MHIHEEGYRIIYITILSVVAVNILLNLISFSQSWLHVIIYVISFLLLVWSLIFFRVPDKRKIRKEKNLVISPADGKIVVIEEINEPEYFKGKCIQVSIFMSIFNVHVNWFPIDGVVRRVEYEPGDFLFARNPKSSDLNERNTVAVEDYNHRLVVIRQIAGVLARRIVCDIEENDLAQTGEELGMIRFGSRVDLFLPLGTEVKVRMGQKVRGKRTVIAKLIS